jgi:hypothetical protein
VGVGVEVGEEDTAYSGIEAWSSGICLRAESLRRQTSYVHDISTLTRKQ